MIPTQPLTGQALLDRVSTLTHLPRRETAIQCGYVIYTRSGQARANMLAFYDGILTAKGLCLQSASSA